MSVALATAALGVAPSVLGGLFDLIDKLFTTDDEKESAKLKLLELHSKGELAQIAVNTTEAQHSSMFVAGWRPSVGWVCSIALALVYVIMPLMQCLVLFVLALQNNNPTLLQEMPQFDLSGLLPVLLGMLGLGAMRSFERVQGVARNTL